MIVVDTTVLVYAVGVEHRLREPSRRLIEAVRDGKLEATTTIGVIQEFAGVRARRWSRREAASLARRYADLFSPLLVVPREQLDRGLTLFERHDRLGSFDAVLAAMALAVDAEALVSADEDFAGIPRLAYVGLDAPELDELVSR